MSTLVVRSLAKSFESTQVLKGLDLTVPDGQFAAVLGPSGCGKTTLLRLLAGFERADSGAITIGERGIAGPGVHIPPEHRRVGIVPQEGALFPHLCVADNVGFGLGRKGRRERVAEALELVGLADYGQRMPDELSGGQQQRVALARALAPRPGLILLDEPFNALDAALRVSLRQEVRHVLRAAGTTAVLVTHDQEEALSTADSVALLRDGQIVQVGAPREVYDRPCDAHAAKFLGEMVMLAGKLRAGQVECALGMLEPHSEPPAAAGMAAKGTVALRPEQLVIDSDSGVVAEVKDTVFLGHDTVARLALHGSGTEIRARLHAYPPPRVGATVKVRVAGQVSFFPSGDYS